MPLPSDPTPEAYVAREVGKPTLVAAGQYALDGRRLTCGATPTVLDPGLNDYAAAYLKFIIVRPALMARPSPPPEPRSSIRMTALSPCASEFGLAPAWL